MEEIIKYLLTHGGIFGLLFGISLLWIAFREKHFASKDSDEKEKDSKSSEIDRILYIVEDLKDFQETAEKQLSEISPLVQQISNLDSLVRHSLENSIEDLENTVINLQEKFVQANEGLRAELMVRLQKVNDERVIELKTILESYNKTVTDLIVALEKIKILIKKED